MKITDVKLYVLEQPNQKANGLKLVQVPDLLRIQYTHQWTPSNRPVRQAFIEVITDQGISGRCTTGLTPEQLEILRNQVLGADPMHREHLFQKLLKGTRWVYQTPGWFGDFDNCLWDIAGKAAGLPVHALIGRVRQEVGPDYALINDPVCSYDLREAIEVGHAMEELGFVWLEEPFHEQKMNLYQQLCRELTLPVMANETLMHDIGLSAQWLIQGATDRLRANARNGTTQVLKMAHFAELYNANIELNGQGGLFGLLHAHLGCCIDNTDYYEYFYMASDGNRTQGEQWGMLNGSLIEDGHLAPSDGPGWGALWDEKRFRELVVAEY